MANPRFNGRGFTNPLNPLGFHSENRYREETPLGSNFMSNEVNYEAETQVFEAPVAIVLKFAKEAGEVAMKAALKAMQKAGTKSVSVMKAVSKRIGQEVKDAAIKAGEAAKKAGKGAKGQLDAAIKGAKGAGKKGAGELGEGASKGLDDAIEVAGKNADNALTDASKGAKFKPKLSSIAKGTAGATILYAGWGAMGAVDDLLGGDGLFAGLTGENCPEKVEDRGIDEEEDPDAYEEAIQDCQEEAEKKALIVMGVAAVAICGVLYVVLFR